MSQDSAFSVWGSTVLVGTTAVQVATSNNQGPTSYRVRCLVAGYFSWAPVIAGTNTVPTILAPAAPTAGVPSVNTIGMSLGGVEVFMLPPNAFFVSNNAAGFEVTPGEGI